MEAGRNFLAENAKKPGVVTTASGLQYKVLREGTGTKPSEFGEVEVHYRGTLIDGKVFDSSYERGEPISFLLSQVIPGWAEGVQLMSQGAKYEFYIPYDLAYGAQGIPGVIPPYSTLIFEVELLKVYS
ncbi:MAG TPA: FKBP-type peptidyl-prolyl cis-trans isomerase [Oceanobacillus sp.]|nr:FKBP-type peptidyl-prolyl cis-trans isomerase [Oceanobacillus sp.]